MSHPLPLHPTGDLEHVLDDMRQRVMERGDEGLLMRVLTMQFRLALLSLLDTLIDLLAAFRAGRFPPLPAVDEASAPRPVGRMDESAAIAARPETPSPRRTAPGRVRSPRAEDPGDPPADPLVHPVERNGAARAAPAPRPAAPSVSPPHSHLRHHGRAPRGMAGYPAQVPRSPAGEFEGRGTRQSHAHFVALS